MNFNPMQQTRPETRHPLDEVTSSMFIYDALRVVVCISIIVVLTYLACNSNIQWLSYLGYGVALVLGYLLAVLKHTRLIKRIKDTRHYVKHRHCSYKTAWGWSEFTL